MITDGLLYVVGALLSFLSSLLPSSTLTLLPTSLTSIGATIGEKTGPLNAWFPVEEMFTGLVIVLVYWLPAVIVYQLVFWIYKHLPVIGKG